MSIDEFIASSKNSAASLEDIQAFENRCKKREEQFTEDAKRMAPDAEFLNRQYNI